MTDLDERWTDVVDRLEGVAGRVHVRPGRIDAVERRASVRQRNRIVAVTVGAVLVVGVGVAAVVRDDRGASTIVDSSPSTVPDPATSTDSTVTFSTVISPLVEDELARLGRPLRRGDSGLAIGAAQDALTRLGYDAGDSGVFDERMEQAVLAFEGLALDRPWQQQTGQLTRDEVLRLFEGEFTPPTPLRSEPQHTEILLDRQVLVVYRNGAPAFIAHISSGSGEQWCETQTVDVDSKGQRLPEATTRDVCGVADTPGGVFQFYKKVPGAVQGDYGGMMDPVFFNYGIAVHGAVNVPREPVSHGGVRIPLGRSADFSALVDLKEYVYVFDGVTEPEDVARDRSLPTFVYPNPDSPGPSSSEGFSG